MRHMVRTQPDEKAERMTPLMKKFVMHWSEMGLRWGMTRATAEVFGLLLVSPRPLDAEEISAMLGTGRSTISTSIRELQHWGLIRSEKVAGRRKAYFRCLEDPRQMIRNVLTFRIGRELDPVLEILRECIAQAQSGGATERSLQPRFARLLDPLEDLVDKLEVVARMPNSSASSKHRRTR